MTKRIVRAITRLNIGGPARQALLLTRALRPGYETTLITGVPQAGEGELSDPEVVPTRIPLVRPLSPTADLKAYRALKATIEDVRPALVHTHMAKAGALGRRAARSVDASIRTVHTFHGHVLDGYFRPSVERVFIEIERRLARKTDALVAVSDEVRDALLDLRIGSPQQWRVIPLGFELDDLLAVERPSGALRAAVGVASDTPLVGVLGRLAPIKDHATLLEAMSRLESVHLVVLGDGELRQQLEGKTRAMHLGDRVHFLGWWTDVPSAMSDLDVVALTSRNEGTPVSLIEALAAGVPVVATDVGGVRSVVEDEVSGYITQPRDAEAIARAIRALLDDGDKRRVMGAAGRVHVRERFSSTRLIADTHALYEDLLS